MRDGRFFRFLLKQGKEGGIGNIVSERFEPDFGGMKGDCRRTQQPVRRVDDSHAGQRCGKRRDGLPEAKLSDKRQRLIHQRRGTAIGFACGRRNQRNAAAGVCECQRSQRSGQSGTDNGNFKMLHGLRFPSTLRLRLRS